MSSEAKEQYKIAVYGTNIFAKALSFLPRSHFNYYERQTIYGSSIVILVAAWNAYINNLIRAFYKLCSNPQDRKYDSILTIANQNSESLMGRFNNPNSNNTHNILMQCTGYDPWNDWQWTTKNMDGKTIRNRLDEIIKIRHSIAHGFSMPKFQWNVDISGRPRLTSKLVNWNRLFFNNLVTITDNGLKDHIINEIGIRKPW